MATQDIQWHYAKASIPPPGEGEPERFVMSQDTGTKGAKCFAAFDGHVAALRLAECRKGDALYEVIEHSHKPCKMFLDVDRHDVLFETDTVIEQLLHLVMSVLRTEFETDVRLEPGVNCQIAQATTAAKTSVHAVFDIKVASVTAHRFLADRLAMVASEASDQYPSLLFLDPKDNKQKCVIDLAVYTSFRSYRMLHMVKIGKKNPLTPCAGSSSKMADHLVGYYPSMHDGKLIALPAPANEQQPLIRACTASKQRKREPAVAVSVSKYPEFEKTLNSWRSVTDMFPAGIRIAAVTENPRGFHVRIHKLCGAKCPYAKRPHKSNNLYLGVSLDWTKAQVRCYDEDCAKCIDAEGCMLLCPNATHNGGFDSSHAGTGGMHSQAGNVPWDERYSEPAMRPLPVHPIVCVRANMGIGKTIAIKEVLDRVCSVGTKVLIVTFSRALAVKMSTEFEHLGFVNYQKVEGLLQHAKIVTCLDSLFRVATRNFDYIIMDECVSTFLHFNSSLMNKRAENSALLELLITQTSLGVYFVDAALDFTFMKNIVDYFAIAKRTTPYWIYNEYVRPTNRKAQVVLCDGASMGAINEYSLIYAAAKCVLDRLLVGQKVVCCSSTRRFTEILERFIAERSPCSVVKVYNGASTTDDLQHVNTEWVKYDLLIYSPSISAGVSFEMPHFDCLVGYLVSSQFTPSVDKSLQQLFRVRNLTDGEMCLFVHNTRPGVSLPHTVEQITPMLSSDISLVSRYFVSNQLSFFAQVRVTATAVEYDRDRLSWQVLLGIIQMQNSSAMFYTDTLVETLRDDYGIPVAVHMLTSSDDKRDLDLVALQDAASFRKNPVWLEVRLLTLEEYSEVQANYEDASTVDKASMRLYTLQHTVWGVSNDVVDEQFYNELVMSHGAMDEYYRAKRFKMLTTRTLEQNRGTLTRKFEGILGMEDRNLELFKTKCKVHYTMLTAGHSIFGRLLGARGMENLARMQCESVTESDVNSIVNGYTSSLNKEERSAFDKTFSLKSDAGGYRTLLTVARKAFNVEVSRGATNCQRAAWTSVRLQNKKLKRIEEKYKPTFPNMGI
jgi:hypothetical protein